MIEFAILNPVRVFQRNSTKYKSAQNVYNCEQRNDAILAVPNNMSFKKADFVRFQFYVPTTDAVALDSSYVSLWCNGTQLSNSTVESVRMSEFYMPDGVGYEVWVEMPQTTRYNCQLLFSFSNGESFVSDYFNVTECDSMEFIQIRYKHSGYEFGWHFGSYSEITIYIEGYLTNYKPDFETNIISNDIGKPTTTSVIAKDLRSLVFERISEAESMRLCYIMRLDTVLINNEKHVTLKHDINQIGMSNIVTIKFEVQRVPDVFEQAYRVTGQNNRVTGLADRITN